MPFEFIQIPANGQGSAKEELNKLLRGGRIASVRKEFVPNGEDSFWAFSSQSRGDCVSKPRVARNSLPRDIVTPVKANPIGVVSGTTTDCHSIIGVGLPLTPRDTTPRRIFARVIGGGR
jgi:hypothetical protein